MTATRAARRGSAAAVLVLLAAPAACRSTYRDATPPAAADDAISADEIRRDVAYLASDALEGRGSGTPGGAAAAAYIAQAFRRCGLEPAGSDGGYFRPFDVTTGVSLGTRNELRASSDPTDAASLACPDAFVPLSFSASAEATGGVVFAGYGIQASEFG